MRNLRDRPPVIERPFGVLYVNGGLKVVRASFPVVCRLAGVRPYSMQSRGTEFAEFFAAQDPR
jgi:hypothetical protein